jgi:hypothetical protein
MEDDKSLYLKTDDNRVINEKYIRWVKKMDECLNVCTRSDGCSEKDTHKICKLNNPDSYDKLNDLF